MVLRHKGSFRVGCIVGIIGPFLNLALHRKFQRCRVVAMQGGGLGNILTSIQACHISLFLVMEIIYVPIFLMLALFHQLRRDFLSEGNIPARSLSWE